MLKPMNLQLFADEGATTSANADTGTASGQQQTGTAQQAQTEKNPAKTYTEEDMQKVSTAQFAAGIAKVMRQAGFEPDKTQDFEAQIKALKAWQDSQKTELQKAGDALTAITGERDTAKKELETLQNRFMAVSKGIPSDKADKYVQLAKAYVKEGEDFGKALDAAIADFPVPTENKNVPGSGGNPPPAANKEKNTRPNGVIAW